ncbi:hypothetical protein CC86DRAFT_136582 [Ophiobolus disseminans]|uniref:Uncharacterized protein n=1 Tax=Ophiobolus disseminans TaxID=1469910 RepID=A0A6A7ADJ5_9PLEO|nr:hypothetical protein CC86DRAFT_136582 [Ophiobolus disseminans]
MKAVLGHLLHWLQQLHCPACKGVIMCLGRRHSAGCSPVTDVRPFALAAAPGSSYCTKPPRVMHSVAAGLARCNVRLVIRTTVFHLFHGLLLPNSPLTELKPLGWLRTGTKNWDMVGRLSFYSCSHSCPHDDICYTSQP